MKKVDVPNTVWSDRDPSPMYVYEIDEEKLRAVRCSDGHAKGLEATIAAIGAKGWTPEWLREKFQEKYPAQFQEYRDKGFVGVNDDGDFALLAVDEKPGERVQLSDARFTYPPRCVKMKTAPVAIGAKIWNVSFPSFERTPQIRAQYEPRVSGDLVYSKRNHALFSYADLAIFDDAFLFGSTDVEGRSRGSSVIDANGEVVGVVDAKMGNPNQYQRAAAVIIPLSTVWSRLKATLGESYVQSELVDGCTVAPSTTQLLDLIRSVPTAD